MSDELSDIPSIETKGSKKPLLIGAVLAVVAAAGGFLLGGKLDLLGGSSGSHGAEVVDSHGTPITSDVSRIAIDPIVVSLPPASGHRHLRITVQLEVDPAQIEAVTNDVPRFVDMMNGYLRAVEVSDFQDPTILHQIKAHLLARMQIIAPTDSIKGLLIMEFILT